MEGLPRDRKPGDTNDLSANVRKLSDEIGLKMKRPAFIACSRPALEVAEYAKEQGAFDRFHLAVFQAYWENCKNIGLRSILRGIAESCGLNGEEVEHLLDEARYSEEIDRQNEEARVLGISGIPAYIIGEHLIEGAQPYAVFRRVVESIY
jgi:predicted DsbA family dithiol-disulfide isomerase